ncbi:MAG: lysophospholipid acyltransferase family protein [Deltaproteobacteria bacterium]|nr:lysophospholipid acyltransferase family protein [Deltaproteobacteria bacterium]
MGKFSKKYMRSLHKRIRSIRRWFQWHLLFVLIRITRGLAIILPESLAFGMGEVMSGIWHKCARKNKMQADQSLKTAFPRWRSEQRERVVRAVFRNLGRSAIELFRFYGGKYDLLKHLHIDNIDRLTRALEKGRGVIIVSAHLGNWELLACAASALGFPTRVVANRIRDSRIDRLLYQSRSRAGVAMVFRDERIVHMLRHLRDKEILAILIDQDSHFNGIFVSHFNQPTYTARGPAILALASGAPIVPVFIARDDDGLHRVYMEEPIVANPSEDREQEIRRITQSCMDIVERYIRQFPDQWVWMHRRWKTRPKDSPQPD